MCHLPCEASWKLPLRVKAMMLVEVHGSGTRRKYRFIAPMKRSLYVSVD